MVASIFIVTTSTTAVLLSIVKAALVQGNKRDFSRICRMSKRRTMISARRNIKSKTVSSTD